MYTIRSHPLEYCLEKKKKSLSTGKHTQEQSQWMNSVEQRRFKNQAKCQCHSNNWWICFRLSQFMLKKKKKGGGAGF